MKLSVQLDSENDALTGPAGPHEVARLLRLTADQIEGGADCGRLMDYNGNRVGSWDLEKGTEYRCADCGEDSTAEHEGQTCQECGRGMIEELDQ